MPYVTCPDCDHEALAPRELVGLEWTCPKCGASFVVEGDEPRAPLRRRKRTSAGPWVAVLGLLVAGIIVFGILAAAVSRATREPERARNVAREPVAKVEREVTREVRRSVPDDDRSDSGDTGIGRLIVGVLALVVGLPFYLAPTLVALARGHNNVAPIFVVNFFLGWALVGWVIALSWAFTDLKHLENRRRSYL